MANVGYATLQIIPSARGFGTSLSGQVGPQMGVAGATSGKKFGAGILSTFKSVAGPLAAVAGTAAIGGFFKSAITGASDLNETISKSKVIFGDAAGSVEKYAKDASRNILLTTQQAIDASATFGVFGKSAGLTGKDLAGFSTDLTSLASDLSSFSNTTTDEAITAIGAALRGESEPIRKYGVLLDDASLRQEALRQGLVKTTKEALTPQTRVLAAQALIFKQTKDAQGDAARTSAGFANQQRILAKNFQDIKVEVGTALLPVITKLTTLLSTSLKPAFEGIKTVAKPIIDFFKAFASGTGQAGATATALKNTLSGIGTALMPIVKTLQDFGKQIIAVVGPALAGIGSIIANQLLPAFRSILPILVPVANFFLKIIGGAIVGALKGAIGVIQGVLKVISGIFNVFAGIFTGDWKKLWTGVKQIFTGLIQGILGAVQVWWNLGILNIFRRAGLALLGLVRGAMGGLKGAFVGGLEAVLAYMKNIPMRIIQLYIQLPRLMINVGKNIISGLINGIKSMAGALLNMIKSTITDKLPEFVKKALGIQSPSKVFEEIGKNVGLGFIKGVQGTQDKIRDTFAKLAEDIKKTGSKVLIAAVTEAQKKILDLAKSRDVLVDQYKNARDALADLRKEAADYAASVKDAIIATGNFAEALNFNDIVSGLTTSLDNAKAFTAAIKELKNAGLNNTALKQLVDAGPTNALAAAQSLIASGSIGIQTVNELQAELAKQGEAIGNTISGSIYDAAIGDAKKTVESISADLTKVEDKIVGVAAALAREIAKIGKIDPPAWLKDLVGLTKYTNKTASAPSSPTFKTSSTNTSTLSGIADASNITINNYNPIAEPTSVTVSNTLTRLALIG